MKKYNFALCLFFASFSLFCEYYSGNTDRESRIVRLPVWAFLEGQPGTIQEEEMTVFTPPKEALQEESRFLLLGMSYGWYFSYTPEDKRRGVKEVFEMDAMPKAKIEVENIKIREVRIKYPYVYSWAEYALSEKEVQRHSSWNSLKYKSIKGVGRGWRKDELKGVKDAYNNAIKDAIFSYAKKNIKNKPKEIVGEILIKSSPHLSCASGFFRAEVELYINIKETIPYTSF